MFFDESVIMPAFLDLGSCIYADLLLPIDIPYLYIGMLFVKFLFFLKENMRELFFLLNLPLVKK